MASSFTDLLKLELQADGENEGTWDDNFNDALEKLEHAAAGRLELLLTDADVILNTEDGGDESSASSMILDLSGTLTDDINIIAPNRSKIYIINNACEQTNGETVSIKTASGAALEIPNGESRMVWCDGLDGFRMAVSEGGAEVSGSFTATLTGFASSPQGTVTYNKIGDRVILTGPAAGILGVSNANFMRMQGLPGSLIPSVQSIVPCQVVSNHTRVGVAAVATNGDIIFSIDPNGDGLSPNGFLTSFNKGINFGWSITYVLGN